MTQDENPTFPGNLYYGWYNRDWNREQAEAKDDVEKELLSITSMEDLDKYPVLNSLWEKTMLLLSYATVADKNTEEQGQAQEQWLARQEQGLVVHDMVSASLPPIVVWLAN